MTIEQMKANILSAYPHSDSWKDKVSKMSDQQVIAIYSRLLNTGKLKGL